MQYQVYEEKTGELIAWIDTKDSMVSQRKVMLLNVEKI